MKSNSFNTIKWLSYRIRKQYWNLFIIVLFNITDSVLGLYSAVILKDLIDSGIQKDTASFYHNVLIFLIIFVIQVILMTFNGYIKRLTNLDIKQELQKNLFSDYLYKDYASVTTTHSVEWLDRVAVDCGAVANAVTNSLPALASVIVDIVGGIYLLFNYIPSFSYGFIFVLLLAGLFSIATKRHSKKLSMIFRDSESKLFVFLHEHLSNLLIIKSFNREANATDSAEEQFGDVKDKYKAKITFEVLTGLVKRIVIRGAYAAILIYCVYLIINNRLSYGSLLMINRLATKIRKPLTEIGSRVSSYYEFLVHVERLMHLDEYPDDRISCIKTDQEIKEFYDNEFKEIVFDKVSFSYEDKEETIVLKDVDLVIPKNSCIAITGITGSGKSTIFKLLMSMYEVQDGRIMIKDINDNEIALDNSYRKLYSYVPQGNQLMSGSIREVVAFDNKEDLNKDEEIWWALQQACIKDFVEELPEKLDAKLGENGLGFSQGQLQRTAIARALFTKRPILLLDEATSSLDEKTEEQLLHNLKAMSNYTVLIVTHRPKVLSICDKVINIDHNVVTIKDL